MQPTFAPLLFVERDGLSELTLYGSIQWVSDPKKDAAAWSFGGNPTVYGRSTLKPWMVRPFSRELLQELPELKQRAIAVSSHDGTAEHVRVAQSLFAKTSSSEHLERQLNTPLSLPMNTQAARLVEGNPTRWQHPCSGEHAAILLGLYKKGISGENYQKRGHEYFSLFLVEMQKALGTHWSPQHVACDGCGLPTLAHSLSDLASLYWDLAQGGRKSGPPETTWIWEAMTQHPEMVGGEARTDTCAMRAGGGKVAAKEGADGLMGLSIADHPQFPQGLGIAIKLAHGFDVQWMPWMVRGVLGSLNPEWGTRMKVPPTPKRQTIRLALDLAPPGHQENLRQMQALFDQETRDELQHARW